MPRPSQTWQSWVSIPLSRFVSDPYAAVSHHTSHTRFLFYRGDNVSLKRGHSARLFVSSKQGVLQDTQDPNPLIRALAVRTMGCIRVDKITEYLCDPLQRCLKVSVIHAL